MSILSRFRSTPPSRPEYLKLFLAVLANRGVTPTLVDEAAFVLRMPSGDSVYLDNGYAVYITARPAERQAILERFAQAAMATYAIGATYAEAEPTLLPVVRRGRYTGRLARA